MLVGWDGIEESSSEGINVGLNRGRSIKFRGVDDPWWTKEVNKLHQNGYLQGHFWIKQGGSSHR